MWDVVGLFVVVVVVVVVVLFEEGSIILVSLATPIKLLATLFCRQVWTVLSTISIVSLRGKGNTRSVKRLKKEKLSLTGKDFNLLC